MKRRPSRLIPEVRALLTQGLSPDDADWIGRLKPESQLAAARKCLQPNMAPIGEHFSNKSRLGGGTGRAGQDAT